MAGSHPADPGSSPGLGTLFTHTHQHVFCCSLTCSLARSSDRVVLYHHHDHQHSRSVCSSFTSTFSPSSPPSFLPFLLCPLHLPLPPSPSLSLFLPPFRALDTSLGHTLSRVSPSAPHLESDVGSLRGSWFFPASTLDSPHGPRGGGMAFCVCLSLCVVARRRMHPCGVCVCG